MKAEAAQHGRDVVSSDMAELINHALKSLETFDAKTLEVGFVSARCVRGRGKYRLSDRQSRLYEWIEKKGFVPWETTLAMHYGILGSLLSRGFVVRVSERGVSGVRAR